MSYQVIARKWRPQTFEEVTGQELITQTLRNSLEHDRLHHAYLFSGARGVGKTTTARILAKALNCHKTDKPNLSPCQTSDPEACPSCIEISESRSMDVLEIDAASNTGIDDVRGTIIDNINFNPARDRYKVFIIDEVHQLSKAAFNALLKTLEEPPENVVFVMATTELHKVPETILSRCQEFEFRTITLQKIFDRLKLIADAEKIGIDDDALRELARSGEGSMRDAQSNFDQVISFSSDTITAVDVTNALGFAGVEILSKSINAIVDRDKRAALAIVDDLIARGHDLRNYCRDLIGLFRDLLVYKLAGTEKHLLEAAVFDEKEMEAMSASFAEADLVRFFNSFCETEASLREAVHPRYVLEIGLVKLIEMRSVATLESLLERLDSLAAGTTPIARSQTAATGSAAALQEKKTLKIDSIPEPEPVLPDPPVESIGRDYPSMKYQIVEKPVAASVIPMPIRLPALSAEELEHCDDTRLDDAYEEKLTFNGDDLLPINGIDAIVELLLGRAVSTPAAMPVPTIPNGSTAAAVKQAFEAAPIMPQPEEIVDLPPLGENASAEDLHKFALAHPSVQSAVKVFRAKIVEVKRQ